MLLASHVISSRCSQCQLLLLMKYRPQLACTASSARSSMHKEQALTSYLDDACQRQAVKRQPGIYANETDLLLNAACGDKPVHIHPLLLPITPDSCSSLLVCGRIPIYTNTHASCWASGELQYRYNCFSKNLLQHCLRCKWLRQYLQCAAHAQVRTAVSDSQE